MRANNYWDNFRSYSRQNRLSREGGEQQPQLVNVEALRPPNVAQVTPRQQQETVTLTTPERHPPAPPQHSGVIPTGFAEPLRQQSQRSFPVGVPQPQHYAVQQQHLYPQPQVNSMSRPRRKQKINREHNVSSSSSVASQPQPSSAMVLPMQLQEQEELSRVHPVVRSLTRSIYNQINDFVSLHEQQPDRLAMLYQDLQTLAPSSASSLLDDVIPDEVVLQEAPPPVMNNASISSTVATSSTAIGPADGASAASFSIHNSLGEMTSMLQEVEIDSMPKNLLSLTTGAKPKNMRQQQNREQDAAVNETEDREAEGRRLSPAPSDDGDDEEESSEPPAPEQRPPASPQNSQ